MAIQRTNAAAPADAPDHRGQTDEEGSSSPVPSAPTQQPLDDDRYAALIERYARYAPVYDRRFARYSQSTLDAALAAIPATGAQELMDVACGTGMLAERLAERRPDLRVTGIDISPDMLAVARHRLPGGQFDWKVGKAEALPVEGESYDVLTCNSAFHLVQAPEQALAEFHRVLKPGGVFVLVDWCREYLAIRAMAVFYRYFGRHHRSIRTLEEMSSLVDAAEFTIEHHRRFRVGLYWGMMCIVARKGA